MITAKRQLMSVLILAVICVSALAAEPNEPETELKFEISAKERQWEFSGPIKPKYVAIFSMSDLSKLYTQPNFSGTESKMINMILATSSGQSMSEIQKELLKAGTAISTSETTFKKEKYGSVSYRVDEEKIGLYAFTVDDAKLITEAFIETVNKKAREKLPPLLEEFMAERKQRLQEEREKIADINNKLAEKEPQLNSADSAYKTFKNTDRYKILADSEACEKAKAAIVKMNEMLSILDIELAGIHEKLNVIEQYRKSANFSKATLDKLEQMFVEQMIELRGTEARKEAAVKLRDQDKQFCVLYDIWTGLENVVGLLRSELEDREKMVRFCEEGMANPHPELLPPKVLQNKVTIYPVLAEE
jgi:hypothetical protein